MRTNDLKDSVEKMASTIHSVLQAMDNISNGPASLTARLLQPAPPRQASQSGADLIPPKVARRKRRLTLPLDTSAPSVAGKATWFSKTTQQRTFEQPQSILCQLPAELREEIWKYVILGGRDDGAIAISWRSTGFGRGRASAFRVSFNLDREQWGMGVLGMLCSCRMIYSEAISLLYSVPVFTFHNQNVETFLAFIGSTLQHRRDHIRFLDLRWLSQPKSAQHGSTAPENMLKGRWSYKRIDNIKALSELPNGTTIQTDDGFVHSKWVVENILEGMKGLSKGGVRWGSESTGCYAQEL